MEETKQDVLNLFKDFSVVLTGFSAADIIGTGQLASYFNTIITELGENLTYDLLDTFKDLEISNPEALMPNELEIITDFFNNDTFKPIIISITKLWYLGEWIGNDKDYIISSESYLEGLIWKAIAAHPMGGKQPGYGTWGFPPLTFSSELTNQ